MVRNDVIVKLRLAGEEFDRDFKVKFQDLTEAAEKSSAASGARAGGGFAKGFLGAAGLGALGAAIGTAISSAADLGAELASTSRQFNIGVESLQIWRQAASNAGVTAGDLNDAFGSLTQKIGEANAGNRQAQQSFVDLGIGFKTTAGDARATDAVMLDLAKRISDIKDPSERTRVGMQLLGDDFKALYPLLLDGADGFNRAKLELGEFGAMLSNEEIRDLQKTNTKIEQMKNVLSIRVAGIVAENADAILTFTDNLAQFSAQAVNAANAYFGLTSALDRDIANLPAGLSFVEKEREVQRLARQHQSDFYAGTVDGQRFHGIKKSALVGNPKDYEQDLITPWHRRELARFLAPPPPEPAKIEAPKLTGTGGPRRVGGGTPRRPEKTEEEKQYDAALKAEERMREAIARTLQEQRDSAEVAGVRKFLGERAAVIAETELALARQIPGVQAQTVEGLGKALGYTEDMVKARRAELELQLASNKAALDGKKAEAAAKFDAEDTSKMQRELEEAKEKAKRAADDWRREHEQAVRDVAVIYEDLFTGGTKSLWRNFKDEGRRIIADIAAQWTLAMISGQGFSLNSAASGAMGRSPLASLFSGVGGLALSNGGQVAQTGSAVASGARGLGGAASRALGIGGGQSAGAAGALSGLGNLGAAIPQVGAFLALTQVSNSLGSGIADLLGVNYSKTGGSLFGMLGGFVGGALKGTKRGSVTVGNLGGRLGITGSQGNSRSREDTAAAGAGSLIDAIFQIADQLGGGVDASRGSVSFGMRKDAFRVDPSGRGATKIGNGAVDFGSDQEAAIRFAIQDLIKDGVITGISQASQNLLQRGGDLDQQIEKALLLEQIPKLLRQRTDPLGAAIDELAEKFKRVNDALIEGSASAEQFAQARQLWELEKADAIASIGAASQSLKDFLASLQAGSNSPLSLREQRAEAERQLQPFLTQISAAEAARAEVERLRGSGASAADIAAAEERARTAAGAINQDGFTQASQLLLSISRQSNASSGAFFSDFDRIRALTGQAIGFVDQATARGGDNRDPFARETAANTKDAALILGELSAESRAQGETLRQIAAALSGGGGAGFIGAPRAYVA